MDKGLSVQLTAPDAELEGLSFAPSEPDAVSEWIGRLPMANASDAASQIRQATFEIARLKTGWLERMGFLVEIQDVTAGGDKANLIATLGSGPGGLVLAGHTDTVPFDEGRWQSDALGLNERDNRLYGLGSTDMKGFCPLAMAAADAFTTAFLR